MSNLEQVVRPFQRPDVLARQRIIASSTKITVADAIISWGVAGTVNGAQEIEAIDELGTAFVVLDCDDEYEEIARQSQTRRITQVDSAGNTVPENFVDVQRPTEITFWKAGENAKNYNKTTTWQTVFATAQFSTINDRNKKCKSNYKFDITL